MQRFDELVTARLRMRRWQSADRPLFAEMNADPEVMRYFPAPLDRAASDALVDYIESRFETAGYGLWALERLADGAFLGFAGLNPMPAGTPGAGGTEVGWRLARHAWGAGYATEAGAEALRVALGPAGLTEVWSITAAGNLRSQAVMRRLGLVEHSRYRHLGLSSVHELSEQVAYRSRSAAEGPDCVGTAARSGRFGDPAAGMEDGVPPAAGLGLPVVRVISLTTPFPRTDTAHPVGP